MLAGGRKGLVISSPSVSLSSKDNIVMALLRLFPPGVVKEEAWEEGGGGGGTRKLEKLFC